MLEVNSTEDPITTVNSLINGTDRRIPESEYVYVILTAVTSALSVVGGSSICALYFAFKDMRTSIRQLLLYLAISDTMLALGNLLGVIWYLYRDSSIINNSRGFCIFQSAMTIYFSFTSFFWTVTMAMNLFSTVVLGNTSFTATYMKLFHLLAWITPGLILILALSLDVLGTDTSLKQPSWCWIDPRTKHALLWQFVAAKYWEILAYVTTVVLYATVKIFLRRRGIGDSAQGFANFIIYCYSLKRVRQRMGRYLCPARVADMHTDIENPTKSMKKSRVGVIDHSKEGKGWKY